MKIFWGFIFALSKEIFKLKGEKNKNWGFIFLANKKYISMFYGK